MLATYTAIDGYKIESTSTGAWLMSDADASMITDRVANSPLKNLTANGTITTSAVATNSTTLESSGFSGSNYYSLAYDSALDPGTTGLSAKLWFNHAGISAAADYMLERDSSSTAQNYSMFMNSDGTVSVRVDDNTTVRTATTTGTYDDGLDHCLVMVFDGTDLDLYIDGAFLVNATGSALNTLTNGSATLAVGNNISLGNAWAGALSGVEIDIGVQWTAQTIKNKYESEKVLFNQLELYSIVGSSIQYEVNLLSSSWGNAVSDNYTETLDGTRSGLTWYRKQNFSCTTIPFARSSLAGAKKFLRSTNNVAFTFDERGSLSNSPTADNPISVYKTSNNEQLTFSNPYYQYSFSLRET